MLKFKLNDQSVKDAQDSISAKVKQIISDKELLTQLGNTIVTDVKFQTRRGVSSKTGEKLRPLTKEWVDRRSKIASSTGTADTYSARRSNLTLTGQLLDSFQVVAINKAKVILNFVGIHKPYTNVGGKKVGREIPNEKLAEYVQILRPFLGVRPTLIQQLKNIAIRFIRRKL